MAAYSEQQCSKWLKENCLVNTRKEWLDECFQFLKQEYTGGFSSQTQLNNLVYEQLLMADFQEMSLGTLPNLGAGNIVSNLQGKHILQINSLIDVGQSAYSQIQKLKGKDDPENQKENTNNNNWEPKIKPSRMFFLHMTDGSKSIQAMEYQPIPCLNKSIAPGTKVQIQGPVSCRQGVLLLTSKNIQVLGGSVEELEEQNSMWKALHNAIGQVAPELPTALSYIKDETDTQDDAQSLLNTDVNSMHGHSQLGSNTYQQPSVSNNRYVPIFGDNKRSLDSGQKGNTDQASRGRIINLQQDPNKRPVTSCSNSGMRNNNNDVGDINMFNDEDLFDDNGDENFDLDQLDQIEQEVMDNNDFDDNIDENFDLDQIDQIEKEVIQNNNPTYNRKPDENFNSHTDNEFFDDDFMEDDFDLDDFDVEQSRIALPKMDSGYKKSREAAKTEKNCIPMAKKLKTAMNSTETNKMTSTGCGSTETRVDTTECSGRSFMNYGKVGLGESEESTAQSNKATGKLGLKKLKNSNQSTITFGKQKALSSGMKKEQETAKVVAFVAPSKSKISPFFKVKTEVKSNNMTAEVDNTAFDNNTSSGSTTSMKYFEMGSKVGNKMGTTQDKKPTRKLGMKKNAIEFNTQQSSMNTFVKKENSVEVIDLDEEEDIPIVKANEEPETPPYTYLSQVIKEQPFFNKRTFRIKGYVSTLLSQTVITDERLSWKVVVKVNDGSASVDAVLGEEVLTELLSTPLQSFLFYMLEAKKTRDPVKLQALQQQTVQFQKKLSQTSCLMDILFSPSESNPLVTHLTEPSRDDILGLISQLS